MDPAQTGDEEAYESYSDHHRARSNHRHRYGVQELVLIEPVKLLDHPLLQKRNDCQPAAEYKSAGLGKKQKNLDQYIRRIG